MANAGEISTINNARNETGATWVSIADYLGVTVECLWRWRRGLTKVPLHRWKALARGIGVGPELLCRETYNREFAKIRRDPPQREAETAPDDAPAAPETPQEPDKPPTPPKPPQAAPVATQAASGGWFSDFWKDEDE